MVYMFYVIYNIQFIGVKNTIARWLRGVKLTIENKDVLLIVFSM